MYGDQSTITRVEHLMNRQAAISVSSETLRTVSNFSCGPSSCACEEENMEDQEKATFQDLPVSAFLQILSFVDAKDVSHLGLTCWQFHDICSDQYLWKNILEKDKVKWNQIGHATNPIDYQHRYRNMSYKNIYMRCNPEFQRKEQFNVFHIPKLLMSYLPTRKIPRIVLCGAGLDSDTSIIVRKMIAGLAPEMFKNLGPFPATFPGSIGTGFTVLMENKFNMRLITLYSGTKNSREQQPLENRSERSQLLLPIGRDQNRNEGDPIDEAEAEIDEFSQYEPMSNIKHLCQGVDGFVYVIESSSSVGPVTGARQELHALLNPLWTPHATPLVVLSCVPTVQTPRTPCVTIVEQLKLDRLTRPWKAIDADTDSLSGVTQGIKWLLETIQGR